MKSTKKQLGKLYKKNNQTRKTKRKGGKKPVIRSILKTKRKYGRPFNLRYKTLRNIQKRKRDRKHNKPRKIRFLLKGGEEDPKTKTNTGIELTPIKKIELKPIKKEEEKKRDTSESLSMSTPLLSSSQENSQETSKKIVSNALERMKKFQPPQINNISQRTPEQEEKMRKLRELQDSIPPQPYDETKDEEPVKLPEKAPEQEEKMRKLRKLQDSIPPQPDDETKDEEPVKAPSTEPVRTTMSTDENDDYKIITVKVYYPKKALANVISDSGNSAAQTLNVLTSK